MLSQFKLRQKRGKNKRTSGTNGKQLAGWLILIKSH